MVPVLTVYIGSVLLSRTLMSVFDGVYKCLLKRDGYREKNNPSLSGRVSLEVSCLEICLLPILNLSLVGYAIFSVLSNYERNVVEDLQDGSIEKIPEDEIKKEKRLTKKKKDTKREDYLVGNNLFSYYDLPPEEKIRLLDQEKEYLLKQIGDSSEKESASDSIEKEKVKVKVKVNQKNN